MTESNGSERSVAPTESRQPHQTPTSGLREAVTVRAHYSAASLNLSVDPECLRKADLIARANNLPAPRLLAALLAGTPMYQGKLCPADRVETKAHRAAVGAYNQLATDALSLVFAEMESPMLLDRIGQLSSGATVKVRHAIRTLADYAWPVKVILPEFVELRRSLEAFAMYFAFICDADPASVWRGDRGLCARFFADVRQICCCQVEDEDVLSCWDKVSRDLVALRAKDTGYAGLLTRMERAEVKAWREQRAAARCE